MEFEFQSCEDEDERNVYECVVEEIALEGLDGITLQGLWERLIDREGAPISRGEAKKVKSSIWEGIKRDPRLTMYLLPEPRPILKLWNRMLKTDNKGNVEEPVDAPEDIYPFKAVDVLFSEDKNRNKRKKKNKYQNVPLSSAELKRINLSSIRKNKLEMQFEKIRFQRPMNTSSSLITTKTKRKKSKSPKRESNKSTESVERKSRKSKRSEPKSKTPTLKLEGSKNRKNKNDKPQRAQTADTIASTPKIDSKKSTRSTRSKTVEPLTPVQKGSTRNKSKILKESDAKTKKVAVERTSRIKASKNVRIHQAEKIKAQEALIKLDKSQKPKKRGKNSRTSHESKTVDPEVGVSSKNKKCTLVDGNSEMESEEKLHIKLMDVRGSCSEYYTRKDISNLVRKNRITYHQAAKMFGTRLVFVANQFVREFMLFAKINQVRVASQQYCMIERIGRARHYGEQARGKISLTCLNIDAKAQFYHRKALLADRLIAKQGFIMRFPENRTGTLISVFHLPYFYRKLESAEAINIRKIFFVIFNSPNKTMEYYKIQNSFGKHLMRVINETYKEFIEHDEESYAVIHPEEYEKERKPARKEMLLKRKVKVIRLKNADVGIRKLIEKQLKTAEEADDSPIDNQLEDGDDHEEDEYDWSVCHNKASDLAHELEVTDLVKYTIIRGNKGVLLQDIAQHLDVNHLDSRSASRYLLRWKLVRTITEEQDKIKVARYVYSRCDGPKQEVVSSDEEYDTDPLIDVEAAVDALFDSSKIVEVELKPSKTLFIDESDLNFQRSNTSSATVISSKRRKTGKNVSPNNKKSSPKAAETVEMPQTSIIQSPEVEFKSRSSKGRSKVAKEIIQSPSKQTLPMSPPMIPETNISPIPRLVTVSSFETGSDDSVEDVSPSYDKLPVSKISRVKLIVNSEVSPLEPLPMTKPKAPPRSRRKEQESLLKKVQKRLISQKDENVVPDTPPKRRPNRKKKGQEDSLNSEPRGQRLPGQSRTEQYYDDVDRKALGLLKKQRVEWSANEDRTLLHLFVASIAFIPRYNMNRVFIFNSSQIRDILHLVAEESRSKTSIAVRRRIHFLMRNRVFHSKYRNLLNIALRDEHLYRNLVEKYLPQPSMNIYHRIPTEALYSVYEYMLAKFNDKVDLEFDNTEYVTSLPELLNLRELRRMEGVWIDIWGTLLCESDDFSDEYPVDGKCYDSKRKLHEAFDDDNVFEDEAKKPSKIPRLSKAIREGTRNKSNLRLVTAIIKDSSKDDPLHLELPTVDDNSESEPSIEYLDEEIQYALLVSKGLIEDISTSPRNGGDIKNTIRRENFRRSRDSRLPSQEEWRIRLKLKEARNCKPDIACCERDAEDENDVILWAGRTALLCMVFSGEALEAVHTFMASVADPNLEQVISSLRRLGILTVTKVTNKFCLSSQMRRQLVSFMVPAAFRIAHSLSRSLIETNITSLQQYSHTGTVHLLSELSLLLRVDICLPPCIITVHDEWKEDYESLLDVNSNRARDRENYALRLLRLRLNADTEKGKFVEKDFFDINLPQVLVQAKKGIKLDKLIYGDTRQSCANDKIYLENSLIKIVEYYEQLDLFGAPEDERLTREYGWLYDVIDTSEEIGISMHFLTSKFDRIKVKQGLLYLLDCNYIYMVGIHNRKFVAGTYMKHWTTAVIRKSDGTMARRVVMRPWMNARGDMNWALLDRAYTGIFGYLQCHPIILINELCRCLRPIFSNVETMMLISTLIHLEIVDVYRMKRSKKAVKLFTSSQRRQRVDEEDLELPYKNYNVDPFMELEDLFIELMPFYTIKYAKLQDSFFPSEQTENPMSLVDSQEEFLMQKEGVFASSEAILGLGQNVPTVSRILSDDSENSDNEEEISSKDFVNGKRDITAVAPNNGVEETVYIDC